MQNFKSNYIVIAIITSLMACEFLLTSGNKEKDKSASEDYCQYEAFNTRCLKNEVVLVKSATYGRMRIGRCVTADEVEAHRSVVGDDPRYFGCSSDVLPLLDRKCSGKTECEIRMADMSFKNVSPCFPGLILYLEVSYTCISVLDEERSCTATVSTNPVHIISMSASACGTMPRPWSIDTSAGRKINISLLDFTHANSGARQQQSCHVIGQIVDKIGKRNTSICVGGASREKALFLSAGNTVNIYLNSSSDWQQDNAVGKQFLLKIEAFGCSDVIPPDDAWLKRDGDRIVIGCYSSRQNWHLRCTGEKWTGVLGNCSHEGAKHQSIVEAESKPAMSTDEEVLAMVAIVGLTLAICLAIICTGAVCLRRFYSESKKKQEYKTLLSIRSQNTDQRISSALATSVMENDLNLLDVNRDQLPYTEAY